ncbi:YkoF family thiamine/hydroxymethylpyrimidine-binding protein [Actinotalea solisilvae]|uniref:YkoF family thiamine/hydroxymethylpyrimidine-binding protein n=1 Tax=Actinotalea solisilvae TaxID=2072922 RepID=UPI0018F149FE|nr:YkoF family thiamine/hydroxymethylpyrimidine-binding protein [Actinotalea solisilvae]
MTTAPARTTAPSTPSADPPRTTAPAATARAAGADHERLGVGLRFTLLPAADDVVPVVLGSLAAGALAVPAVQVATDDVSTLVRGAEADLARYLVAVLTHAASATPSGHVVAVVHLSRGCPGEVGCDLEGGLAAVAPVRLAPTGLRAAAHWALYPLATADVMGPIGRAIDRAATSGTLARPEHLVTRLEGDLADVLATLVDTWSALGGEVAHVVTHATLSLGSPTARDAGVPAAAGSVR